MKAFSSIFCFNLRQNDHFRTIPCDRLHTILCGYLQELFAALFLPGTCPKDAPFVMQSALLNHFMHGAYYPKGGASEIAFHIIPVIRRSGGNVLVRAPVTNILVNNDGKAVGESSNLNYHVVIISCYKYENFICNDMPLDYLKTSHLGLI